MKWTFNNREIGGCIVREVSCDATIVATIPRHPPNAAGQERAREIARQIVLAHNAAEDEPRGFIDGLLP
jgi:hypothetical protein